MTKPIPYNLNNPPHLIANAVNRRLRVRMQQAGVFIDLGSLPEVEALAMQYQDVIVEMRETIDELRAQVRTSIESEVNDGNLPS